jgi:hypothetical protein
MIKEKMNKEFQRILDKYGIKKSYGSYYYQGSWILDYYGKDYDGNDSFALMNVVNNECEFDKLEEVRSDYTTTEFDNKLNNLIIDYKKAKMKQKLDNIKKDFQ